MKSCEEMTKLASRACDEPIKFGEQIELKLHLMMCKHCRAFYQNNLKVSNILKQYQNLEQNKKP